MKKTVGIASGSIRAAGVPQDPVQVLVEYIWNGFEAGATEVSIEFSQNDMETIDTICVRDNGRGIDYAKLDETFSVFLESTKANSSEQLKPKKNRGKGRYSFLSVAHNADWISTYREEDTYRAFTLSMMDTSCNEYELTDPEIVDIPRTGTTVRIYNLLKSIDGDVVDAKLIPTLLNRFAWFLYLNRLRGFKILINGKALDYSEYINEKLTRTSVITVNQNRFDVSVIVWKERIDGSYRTYFTTKGFDVREEETTGYNNNTVGFSHSVYVVSDYFEEYYPLPKRSEIHESSLIGYKENQAQTMRELRASVARELHTVYEAYMVERADNEIDKMKKRKSFPQFSNDVYGLMRERDLINVTRAIYCTVPDVFARLKPIQEKSLIGFLSLALNGDERDDVLSIVASITNLTSEQRHQFAEILQKTSLTSILEMIDYIEQRYKVIEIIKALITDLVQFSNERDHIQRIIEENYWVFGEQYNLVSADIQMQKSLEKYLKELGEKISDIEISQLPPDERKKRVDIFLCGSRIQDYEVEENLIVELKAPKVRLTLEVVNQIALYAHIIRKERQFNSRKRSWKFIAVCAEIDSDVMAECNDPVEKHLVRKVSENFKVYAMTWDDVFTGFRIRHDHLLRKLRFRQDLIAEEVQREIDNATKDTVADKLTEIATEPLEK